jgi:hypothetical protein
VADRIVKSPIVVVLNIRKTLVPHRWILLVVDDKNMHNYFIKYICFSISLRWKEVHWVTLVPIMDERLDQKILRNLLSL